MTILTKSLIVAAALAAMATPALAEFGPGDAIMFSGGKMVQMQMASGTKNHEMMMKHARKVPNHTVFFMDGDQMYMVSGTLDPTGNFRR